MILLICSTLVILTACATTKTVVETRIEYIHPDIPLILLQPCDDITKPAFSTNGELLIDYITLQSKYTVCAAKVSSISSILDSYNKMYDSNITD